MSTFNPQPQSSFTATVPQQPIAIGIPVGTPSNQFYSTDNNPQTSFPVHTQSQPMVPWSSGLCDCFTDFSNCCMTCWCPCFTFGQTSEIVDRGTSSCGQNGALYVAVAVVFGCPCIYSCAYRTKLRQIYNIDGSPCSDFMTHWYCNGCALCQEYRELRNQGFNVDLGWHGNMERHNGVAATSPPTLHGGMNR
ncbi:protein PLANT CADMIUM RESISTANCE 2-like [Papaver somniferum]|uniref:protein PLANT CADMIUM RESISTANCE 2-like n=1 Tax=Papaver somniferum TaxID=3469 RepID=UPI000E6FE2C5|nr:protein PLANT CADMIUM RESISTANCE 2-like [Papaver somniferum]